MIPRWIPGALLCLQCTVSFPLSSDNLTSLSTVEFPIPDTYQLVNDNLALLTISESIAITKKLQSLEQYNGTQLVFLSVPSIGELSTIDYAHKVANKWDIGNNGQGNGALFLVVQDGRFQILTAAGIGGALPDVKVARILRDIILPGFAREQYSGAIEAAMDVMIKAARGEDTEPTFFDYAHADGKYLSPLLNFHGRLKIFFTREQLLIGVLILFGITYAIILLWIQRRKKRKLT